MTETTTNQKPAWVTNFEEMYLSDVAHAFILHFNVRDYVVPGVSLKGYLNSLLSNRIVAHYDRSQGITFPAPSMEKEFKKIVGFETESSGPDPLSAALGIDNQGDELPRSPNSALPLLEKFLKLAPQNKAAVVIDYAEVIVPNADVAAMGQDDRVNLITVVRWGQDAEIRANGAPIFLITESVEDLHPSIRSASSKFESLYIDLPTSAERLDFITWYMEDRKEAFRLAVSLEEVANMTAGLSRLHVEDILLRAELKGELTKDLVKNRKDSIMASEYAEVIQTKEPKFGFDMIGGHEHVKAFLVKNVIRPMREGRLNRVPQGIMFTGPAGTGKTAMFEALAFEAGVTAVVFNPALILGKYVGDSERNLEKVLKGISAMSPAIVFVDEIDQSFDRGESGDSGVGKRIFRRIMEFMSDTSLRGRVLWVSATNRPDLIDAALRRDGRMDKKIAFLAPEAEERAALFGIYARKYSLDLTGFSVPAEAVAVTDGWTGAELETVIVKASELVEDDGLSLAEAIVEATKRIYPSTQDIEFMTRLALEEANDIDLVPPQYVESWKKARKAASMVAKEEAAEDRREERRGRRAL